MNGGTSERTGSHVADEPPGQSIEEHIPILSKVFKLLGDQTRLRIVLYVSRIELNVSQLCGLLNLSQPLTQAPAPSSGLPWKQAGALKWTLAGIFTCATNVCMTTDPRSPEILISVPSDVEAAAIVTALAARGVQASTVGGYTAGFRAEAPGEVSVVVRRGDFEQAQRALAEIEKDQAAMDWSQVDVGEPDEDEQPSS